MSPEATVETMSFGKPIGSAARITFAARDVPPVPPRATIPWIDFEVYKSFTRTVHASIILLMTSPRPSEEMSVVCPLCERTFELGMSTDGFVEGVRPTSTRRTLILLSVFVIWSRVYRSSWSFVSQVPRRRTHEVSGILTVN